MTPARAVAAAVVLGAFPAFAAAPGPQDGEPTAAETARDVDLRIDLAREGAEGLFWFSDPKAFRIVRRDPEGDSPGPSGARAALELHGPSEYRPPHRSPRAIALLREPVLESFTLDATLTQTGREYAHRDLCLFFGFESASRFYYVHLATTPDRNAHNVFLVDGAPRRNLLPPRQKGVDWGRGASHRVRLVRDIESGLIEVYFDDMKHPVLSVVDRTIGAGRIGFGSFDDTGTFEDIRIRGVAVARGEVPPADANPFAGAEKDGESNRSEKDG